MTSDLLLPESRRIAALDKLRILDSAPEQAYDDLVALASLICDTPIALVSLVGADRQWFKARLGLDQQETPRDQAFCSHAIEHPDELMMVPDARDDGRFADNPLVTGGPRIRFYAGAPILTANGETVGTVCVIDTKPKTLTVAQQAALVALARQASLLLLLRETALASARVEERLLERNEQLEISAESDRELRDRRWELSDDLLFTATYEGRLVEISPSWTRQLGHSIETLRSTHFSAFLHPDEWPSVALALQHLRQLDTPVPYENRLLRSDGSWAWVSWTLSPEPGGLRLTGSGRDVTAHKQQLADLETAESAARQAQKMEAVGQLTGGLAHDFNNLLTGISGSVELLQLRLKQGRFEDTERYITAMKAGVKRATSLTHRLLAFSRRQTLDPKPTDIAGLIASLEDLLRRTVGSKIAFEVVVATDLWPSAIDANQLENAILNLCINARDAMAVGGTLTIEAANRWLDDRAAAERDFAPGPYVCVSVTDTGTGISPETMKKIFDPFFTTKPLGEGTGLGLSMVYGFAKQSGGQVRVHSLVGRGTTMSIYLPRHVGDMSTPVPAAFSATAEPVRTAIKTVLVVDDDTTVRTLLIEVLDGIGHRSLQAPDGAAGLEILRLNPEVDLLVTDVGLPGGMNGIEVADAARTIRPGIPVLFVTGFAENAVLGFGRMKPDTHLLMKPFEMRTFARRVDEILLNG